MAGCRCERCFSLREAMLEITGEDYGLTPAPGHSQGLRIVKPESSSMTDLNPAELARLQHMARKRQAVKQPWDVEAA